MTGTIDRGSLIYDKIVPVSSLQVGDVITYRPPAGSTPTGGLITHRIVSIEKDDDGRPVFRTKGDANATMDPWRFHLDDAKQATVAFHVPYVGYFFGLLGIAWLRMTLVGILSGLVVLRLWWTLWRDAGQEERERERETSVAVDVPAPADISEPATSPDPAIAAALAANAARAASGTGLPTLLAHDEATVPTQRQATS
jgi:signal peptidase I